MWKLFPAVAACAVLATVHAQTIYKCSVNGALWYGDRPCTAGVASELAVTPAPPPDPDTIARLARQHALAQQLVRRDAARAYYDEMEAARELQRARRAASSQKRKCDRLRLRQQWAQEDVRGAADKSAGKAQVKARRQGQAMALECPS